MTCRGRSLEARTPRKHVQRGVSATPNAGVDGVKREPVSLDKIADLIEKIPARRGIVVNHIDIDDITKDDDYTGYCPEYSIFTDDKRTDFSIPVGLQLLDFVDTGFFTLGNRWKKKVLYYHVT